MFYLQCFLKEVENIFSLFHVGHRDPRESLNLKKPLKHSVVAYVSTSFLVSFFSNFHSSFHNSIEIQKKMRYFLTDGIQHAPTSVEPLFAFVRHKCCLRCFFSMEFTFVCFCFLCFLLLFLVAVGIVRHRLFITYY